jgi:membrane-bound ClpP family serine protease
MEWLVVIGFILVGTFLVIGEIVFIPGIFIAGFFGVTMNAVGVFLSYKHFGSTIGTIVLVSTILVNLVGLILVFRGKSWEALALKDVMTGKAKEDFRTLLKVGDKGTTISTLKPVGKAIFGESEVEVSSLGTYIEENKEIEIYQINSDKILVKELI